MRAAVGVGEEVCAEVGLAELSAAIDAFASEMVSTGLEDSDCCVLGNTPQPLNPIARANIPADTNAFFTPES